MGQHHELAYLLGSKKETRAAKLLNQIEGPLGGYVVRPAQVHGEGNSYICFQSSNDSEWQAGQIEYILELDEKILFVVAVLR